MAMLELVMAKGQLYSNYLVVKTCNTWKSFPAVEAKFGEQRMSVMKQGCNFQ